jgi:hypothetical protein
MSTKKIYFMKKEGKCLSSAWWPKSATQYVWMLYLLQSRLPGIRHAKKQEILAGKRAVAGLPPVMAMCPPPDPIRSSLHRSPLCPVPN